MIKNVCIAVLVVIGAACLFGGYIPRFSVRSKFVKLSTDIEKNLGKRRKSSHKSKEYVDALNGNIRENFAQRILRETRNIYKKTGRSKAYQSLAARAMLSALFGLIVALSMKSYTLLLILPVGFYFLPMWLSKFSLYRYEVFLNDELETSLSIVTTSYRRSENLVTAISENLSHMQQPVRGVFENFVNTVLYIDPNIETQIEVMKKSLDNSIFKQWCAALVLCQKNHNQIVNLAPIVQKFSALKAQQQANKNRMMIPLRNAVIMMLFPLGLVPILYFFRNDWYKNLVDTPLGQLSLAVTAVALFVTVNKAINLSKPVEYDV